MNHNATAPPLTTADLLSTEQLGEFLAVLALGAVLGGLLVIVALLALLGDDPSPVDDPEPLTERMAPVPALVDLPRRTREWSA